MQIDDGIGVRYCSVFPIFVPSCMTAIVVIYVPGGFVFASDGRIGWNDAPGRPTREDMQKIFRIEGQQMAYALTGFTANETGSFSMPEECEKQAVILSSKVFKTCYEYVDAFARNLKHVLAKARTDGVIGEFGEHKHVYRDERFGILRIMVAGFLGGHPCWSIATISHRNQRFIHQMNSPVLMIGQNMAFGSELVPELARTGDPRFAQYRARLRRKITSLPIAIDYAKAYVECCSDPLAATIDPICQGIGGRIQIATITPRHGFQWHPGFEASGPNR